MRAAVDEEGCKTIAKRRGCVVDRELGQRKLFVPVILTVGIRPQRVADDRPRPVTAGSPRMRAGQETRYA